MAASPDEILSMIFFVRVVTVKGSGALSVDRRAGARGR
jgi:hypothetical protein